MTKSLYGAFAALALGLAVASPAGAHEHGKKMDDHKTGDHKMSMKTSGIAVEKAWARATPGTAKNGGAYLMIANTGASADRFVAAAADVAERVEIHTHIDDNGIMRMRKVDGIDVPAGGTVMLKPGGYHIMFLGLHKPLKKGDEFPLTLTFEKAGKQTVEVEVQAVGAMKGGDMKHMDHKKH